MCEPHMTPKQAQDWLRHFEAANISLDKLLGNSLNTIAAMTVEEDWRLVSVESNGGLYEQERWTRLQSEWVKDA